MTTMSTLSDNQEEKAEIMMENGVIDSHGSAIRFRLAYYKSQVILCEHRGKSWIKTQSWDLLEGIDHVRRNDRITQYAIGEYLKIIASYKKKL
jgi:hypothetical protein